MSQQFKINKRFKACHRSLTKAEYKELEEQIKEEGIREAVILWKDWIVDGHNRHEIGTKLGIEIPTRSKEFADEDEAERWILRLQLGRRNLSPRDFKLAIGRLYNSEKKESGGDRKSKPQNEVLISEPVSTAEKIAAETGVSHATVERSGKYAEAFEKLFSGIQKQISAKPSIASEACVIAMSQLDRGEQIHIAREVRVGNAKRFDDVVKPSKNGADKTKQVSRAKPPAEKPAAKSDDKAANAPAKPATKQTAKQFADALIKDHVRPLAKGLDQLAKLTGEKGRDHVAGVSALDRVLSSITKMGAR